MRLFKFICGLLSLTLAGFLASGLAAQGNDRIAPGTYQGRYICEGLSGTAPITISIQDGAGGQLGVVESGGERTPYGSYSVRVDRLGGGRFVLEPTGWLVQPTGYRNSPAIVDVEGGSLRVKIQGPCTPFVVRRTASTVAKAASQPLPRSETPAARGPQERTPQTTIAPFSMPVTWTVYAKLDETILLGRARDSMVCCNNFRVARIYFEQAVASYQSTQGMAGLAYTFSVNGSRSPSFHNPAAERYWCEKAYVKAMKEPLPIFDTVLNFCPASALKGVVQPSHRGKIEAALVRVRAKQQADYQGALKTAATWLNFGWNLLQSGGTEYGACINVAKNSVDAEECKRRHNR